MDLMSAQEAALQWGVSLRYVERLLHENRIPGARKYGASWMLPAGAEKPEDPRKAAKKPQENSVRHIMMTAIPLPRTPSLTAEDVQPKDVRELVIADMTYRKGNPAPAMALFQKMDDDDPKKLTAAGIATAAAISAGTFDVYYQVQQYVEKQIARTDDEREKRLLSLPGALAAVSMMAVEMTPQWVKDADFSLFPEDLRPFLLFLHTLHLRNTGDKKAELYTAKASLILCAQTNTFTWIDLYNTLLCAVACYDLGNEEQAEKYLFSAMESGLPYGIIMPFADYLGSFGGLMETCLARKNPQFIAPIQELWERSFKNWMLFHNEFTNENITTILTAQEYQLARLIAHGATYAETARKMQLSVGRVKNVLLSVYSKLYISKKSQLAAFIA